MEEENRIREHTKQRSHPVRADLIAFCRSIRLPGWGGDVFFYLTDSKKRCILTVSFEMIQLVRMIQMVQLK